MMITKIAIITIKFIVSILSYHQAYGRHRHIPSSNKPRVHEQELNTATKLAVQNVEQTQKIKRPSHIDQYSLLSLQIDYQC